MQLSEFNRERIAHFENTFGKAHLIFACQAAVPLIFSTDLLYKMWLNFNTYKIGDEVFKIPHWAVSDLVLSSFCDPVGYKLYKLDAELRTYLQEELVAYLSIDRKRQLAEFLKQFAEKYYVSTEKNIREIHVLTAASILDPDEMGRVLVKRLEDVEAGSPEVVNLLSLYFNLTGKVEPEKGAKNYISLVAESDPSAPGAFEMMLPGFLREKIQMEDPDGTPEHWIGYTAAVYTLEQCIKKQSPRLSLANYGLTDADFKPDGKLDNLLRRCKHLEELALGARESKGLRNKLTTLPTALSSLEKLRILKAQNLGLAGALAVGHLPQLEVLHLGRNEITELQGIAYLRGLQMLWLNRNPVTSVLEMGDLDQLTFIDLRDTSIENLTPLYNFFKRGGEMLFNNKKATLPPFEVIKKGSDQIIMYLEDLMKKVNAVYQLVRCIASEEPRLELGKCSLTDKSFLPGTDLEKVARGCLHIETLILSNRWWSPEYHRWMESENRGDSNVFSEIPAVFSEMKNLKTVICAGDEDGKWGISDLIPATAWPSLTYLDVSNNQLEDPAVLEPFVRKDLPLLPVAEDDETKGVRIYGNALPEDLMLMAAHDTDDVKRYFRPEAHDRHVRRLGVFFGNGLNFKDYDGFGKVQVHKATKIPHELATKLDLRNSFPDKIMLKDAWRYLIPDPCKEIIKSASVIALELDADAMQYPWEMFIDDEDKFIGLHCTFVRKSQDAFFSFGLPDRNVLVLSNWSPESQLEADGVGAIFKSGGFEVTSEEGRRFGTAYEEIASRSYQVIYLSDFYRYGTNAEGAAVPYSHFEENGITRAIEWIEQLDQLPEVVFLNFNGSAVFASRLSRLGVQVIALAGSSNIEQMSMFPVMFFGSILAGISPLHRAFHFAQGHVRNNHGDEVAIVYQCYGHPGFIMSPASGNEVLRIERMLGNVLENMSGNSIGVNREIYLDQYNNALQRIEGNVMVAESTSIVQLLAAIAERLGLFNQVAGYYSRLISLYDKIGDVKGEDISRSAFNRILKVHFDSSLEDYEAIEELAVEYERIRREMPASNERTMLMTDVFDQMKKAANKALPLLPIFKSSNVAGERLAAIAALHIYAGLVHSEWLADRVGDAESFFVGFQAVNGLYAAIRAFRKNAASQLLRIVNRAKGNLLLSTKQDPNQRNVLDSILFVLNDGDSSVARKQELKLANGIGLDLLEGDWSGLYIHFGQKTAFKLIFSFYDGVNFTGVVKDDGPLGWADIEGAVDIRENSIQFTKRYRAAHNVPVYYNAAVKSPAQIFGRFKVGNVEGQFEIYRIRVT